MLLVQATSDTEVVLMFYCFRSNASISSLWNAMVIDSIGERQRQEKSPNCPTIMAGPVGKMYFGSIAQHDVGHTSCH